ncbi:putative manganese transporter [uncultured Adlercreutzia sp.]|uniref:putative manganese transporter n=1 Tax=uncultured Adlercreutzia sp. TaxID=875803 RepID=UPI0025F302B1|nr:putative manganese transporter [uncultured Adlercreutzia sp.]MCI9262561.1 arsenic efflux protein [Eggerthellaceae bacterium]
MEEIAHIAEHVLEHSLADTLYLIPFLFVTYLAMEWLEHKTGAKTQNAIRHAGAAGPIVGALLGVVPQCGFSAVAATLWAGRVITLGTLFAVFLSTSDEMLPIFLAEQVPGNTILSVMGAKVVIGMVMGFIVDAVLRLARRDKDKLRIHELCEQDKCGCNHDCEACEENPELAYQHYDDAQLAAATEPEGLLGDLASGSKAHRHEGHEACECAHDHETHAHDCGDHDHAHDHGGSHDAVACCHHDHSHDAGWKGIVKSALVHTVQVTLFIFIITIALNIVLETVGEDAIAQFLGDNPNFSVFATALVGLIPNCAASVVIAQLYVDGVLGAGAMLAGLLVSAGVGLLVLARANRHWKQNLAIIVILYGTGVFWGLICNGLGVVF